MHPRRTRAPDPLCGPATQTSSFSSGASRGLRFARPSLCNSRRQNTMSDSESMTEPKNPKITLMDRHYAQTPYRKAGKMGLVYECARVKIVQRPLCIHLPKFRQLPSSSKRTDSTEGNWKLVLRMDPRKLTLPQLVLAQPSRR